MFLQVLCQTFGLILTRNSLLISLLHARPMATHNRLFGGCGRQIMRLLLEVQSLWLSRRTTPLYAGQRTQSEDRSTLSCPVLSTSMIPVMVCIFTQPYSPLYHYNCSEALKETVSNLLLGHLWIVYLTGQPVVRSQQTPAWPAFSTLLSCVKN